MRNRREESAILKKCLVNTGFDRKTTRVRAGTGTAWGWWGLSVNVAGPKDCSCKYHSWGPLDGGRCDGCKAIRDNAEARIKRALVVAGEKGVQFSHFYSDGPECTKIQSVNYDITLSMPQ